MPIPRKSQPEEGSIAQRLDLLFEYAHPADRGPYTVEEVAAALTERGDKVAASYIYALRSGAKDNPTVNRLRALADFFGVPVTYFFEEQSREEIAAALEMARVMRKHNIVMPSSRALGSADSPDQARAQAERWERIASLLQSSDLGGRKGVAGRTRPVNANLDDDGEGE
ncbi:helix-turn-helix domain-containing protein [Kineococcus sp. SYSU DK006]|uniref:helix-turn-helix domain-containing protein n=1 Tax=Kineococcus sp. SYSU DK006 TaxID=3383127 RepID=UPI003D7F00B1